MMEGDEGTPTEGDERQKRLGLLRADVHTVYDIPLQVLDAVPTEELRRIANPEGDYSKELQWKAQSIIRVREDPQDRDAVRTEM